MIVQGSSLDSVLIPNSLAVAERLLSKSNFIKIENLAKQVHGTIKGDFKTQEYYGAAIKKLAFVFYNSKKVRKSFGNTGLAENKFNAAIVMSLACLDSLSCVINRTFGDKLLEKNVNPLNPEFVKTIHSEKIKAILSEKEFKKQWENISDYRNTILHRSAVTIVAMGKNHPSLGQIEDFGVIKNPSDFLSNVGKNLGNGITKMDEKTNELKELTMSSFVSISNALLSF